jgi:peptidoglycan/LPS O-acetylase OafA/YrhL
MLRSVISVVCGFVTIVILALLTDLILMIVTPGSFSDDGATRSLPLLVLALVYGFLFSAFGGYVTALIAKRAEIKHAVGLIILHLTMSIISSIQFAETAPMWWHASAIALIIPSVLLGSYLRLMQKRASGEIEALG